MAGKEILFKDITKYNMYSVAGELPYSSDRSVTNYKNMRNNPIIALGLQFTTLGLADVPFILECEDETVQAVTDKMMSVVWRRLVRDSYESLIYGWKPFELRYEPGTLKYKMEKDGPSQNFQGILLKQPRSLDPEYIRIQVEEDGSLRGFKQDYSSLEVTVKDRKCLIVVHQFESGNYYGISAMEPIYSTWYKSGINIQFHMRWLERKGTGIFMGRYPVGVDKDGQDNSTTMMDLLDSIMEGTAVALPSGYDANGKPLWDIHLLDSDDKTDAFIAFHEYLDKIMLRGLIIPERALTQGEVGARASVEAYTDIFMQRKQDILDSIVDYINRYLVKNFVEINWGSDIEINLKAGMIGDASRDNAYKIIEKLVEKGVIDVDPNWLIDKTGIPILEKEEPEMPEEMVPEEGVPAVEDQEEEIIPDEEKKKPAITKVMPKEELKKMGEDRWQSMTARERKFHLQEMDGFLTSRSEQFQSDISSELRGQAGRLKSYLDKNLAGQAQMYTVVEGISIDAAPIRRIYSNFLGDVYAYCLSNYRQSLDRMVFSEESKFIGFRVTLSSDKLVNDLDTAIKHAAANGISRGASKAEIMEAVQLTIDEFLGARIVNIAETEIGFTLSKTLDMLIMENKKQVEKALIPRTKLIERLQYTAIMDGRVCGLCAGLNGMVVNVGSPIVGRYNPPLHYMCRCIWMPITVEEIEDPRVADTDLSIDEETDKPYTVDGLTAQLGALIHLKTFK